MDPQGVRLFDESRKQSFEQGRSEGRAAEKAADVLAVLDARGLTVTDAQRERILACKDIETLTGWLRRAATVDATDALFE